MHIAAIGPACLPSFRFLSQPALLIRPSQARERGNRLSNTAHRSGGIVASRAQAFTQILHQPCGLIAPSTLLQAFGAWNSRQLAQFWLPFGEP
jgi:hypothetical protein